MKPDTVLVKDDLETTCDDRTQLIPKPRGSKVKLKFESLTDISFWFFVTESVYYILTYLTHKLVTVSVHVLFGLYGQSWLIGRVSYAYYTMNLFSSGIRSFQKPISVICGPLYSKRDFYAYRVQRNKLFIMNTVYYLAFACLIFALEPLYTALNVDRDNLADIVSISRLYILCFCPTMFITKFLKGTRMALPVTCAGVMEVRQFQVWFLPSSIISYFIGIMAGFLCVVYFDLAIHACTVSFCVKYALESVVFAVVLLRNGASPARLTRRFRGVSRTHPGQRVLPGPAVPGVGVRDVDGGHHSGQFVQPDAVPVRAEPAEPGRGAKRARGVLRRDFSV